MDLKIIMDYQIMKEDCLSAGVTGNCNLVIHSCSGRGDQLCSIKLTMALRIENIYMLKAGDILESYTCMEPCYLNNTGKVNHKFRLLTLSG